MGGSEWVRSQKLLGAWRRKDWHGLHESSYCYFKVYAGTGTVTLNNLGEERPTRESGELCDEEETEEEGSGWLGLCKH